MVNTAMRAAPDGESGAIGAPLALQLDSNNARLIPAESRLLAFELPP